MDIFKLELEQEQKDKLNFRFNSNQLSLINNEFSRRHLKLENIKKYYTGNNVAIQNKQINRSKGIKNQAPQPYGRLLATTTIGYMLKKDPEILIKNNEEQQIKLLDELNKAGGYNALKEALANTIIYGVGYTLVFQTQEDNKVMAKIQSLHPTECLAIYDYSIVPKLLAVYRKYSLNGSNEIITEIYYQDSIIILKNNTVIKEVQHSAGVVPIAVCFATNEAIGVIEPVIKLIDALDIVLNSDLDEIEKFAQAIRIAYGIQVDPDTMKAVDEGDLLEIPHVDPNSRIEYLTRNINDTFRNNTRDYLVDKIHKLSQVPDFSDPNFSGISGIALEYKLMGFENLCGDFETKMIESIKQVLFLIDKINNIGNSRIDKYNIWINMARNLPRDDQYKLQNATLMKNMGLSKETYIGYLSDYVDDVNIEIDRQNKEVESISLFPQGNYDSNNDYTDVDNQQE